MNKKCLFSAFLFFALSLQASAIPPAQAQETYRILILPFNIHSEQDLAFLRKGIQDMLATRLAKDGKIFPIPREKADEAAAGFPEINEDIAFSLGKDHAADFVVFGSLTVFGESISTDARILDVAKDKSLLVFNDTGSKNGDVITHINRFAEEINGKVFGRTRAETSADPAQTAPADDSRKHPESLWTGQVEGEARRPAGRTEGYGKGAEILGSVWKSRSFRNDIRSLDAGDVDGDGKTEIAFCDERHVLVYRLDGERFIKIGEVSGNANDQFISIDVADINGNGNAEIFVTNVNASGKALRSFVLEWDGARFNRIVDDVRWYFRVLDNPQTGPVLLGQKRGVNRIFLPGIDELIWSSGSYQPSVSRTPARKVNIFSFNAGELTGASGDQTVYLNKQTHLVLMDQEGGREWESPDPYGGTATYLEFPMEASARIGSHKEQDHYYIPQRILISDVDGDGQNEILLSRNRDAAGRLFSRIRIFKGGQIECLGWDNFGLYPEWKTHEISGHLSDYTIADFDNDGAVELVFSIVKRTSSVLGDARSYIAAQDILPAKK